MFLLSVQISTSGFKAWGHRVTQARGKRTVKSRTAGVSTAGEIQIKFFWVTAFSYVTFNASEESTAPETARFHLHEDHKLKSRSVFSISVSAAFWNVSRTKPKNRKQSHRRYSPCITNLQLPTVYIISRYCGLHYDKFSRDFADHDGLRNAISLQRNRIKHRDASPLSHATFIALFLPSYSVSANININNENTCQFSPHVLQWQKSLFFLHPNSSPYALCHTGPLLRLINELIFTSTLSHY